MLIRSYQKKKKATTLCRFSPSVNSFHISYSEHIYTGYKFNKYIVLQFGPVKIKVPNKLLQVS